MAGYPASSGGMALMREYGRRRSEMERRRGQRAAAMWGAAGDAVGGIMSSILQHQMYEPYRRQAEENARMQALRSAGVEEHAQFHNEDAAMGPPQPLRNPFAIEAHRAEGIQEAQLDSSRATADANQAAVEKQRMSDIVASFAPKIHEAAKAPDTWPGLRTEMLQEVARVSEDRAAMLDRQLPARLDGDSLQQMALAMTNTIENRQVVEAAVNGLAQVARMTMEHPPVNLKEAEKPFEVLSNIVRSMHQAGASWDDIEAQLLGGQYANTPMVRAFVATFDGLDDPLKAAIEFGQDPESFTRVVDAAVSRDGYGGTLMGTDRGRTEFVPDPDRVTRESLTDQGRRRGRLFAEAGGNGSDGAPDEALTAFQIGGGERKLPTSGLVTVRWPDGRQMQESVETMSPQERIQIEMAWKAGQVEVAFPLNLSKDAVDPFSLDALMRQQQ